MNEIWLASSSPRRSDLLKNAGLSFTVVRPDIDETPHPAERPDLYVARLSREKSRAAINNLPVDHRYGVLIAADTTVADGDQILGKPDSGEDATAMLRQLRGRPHFVHTGVTVLDVESGDSATEILSTQVVMRAYTDEEIAAYVASGDAMGKAGSYAIQNAAFHPVERCDGCYTNVVGLPVCAVRRMLAGKGIQMPAEVGCSPDKLPCQFGSPAR